MFWLRADEEVVEVLRSDFGDLDIVDVHFCFDEVEQQVGPSYMGMVILYGVVMWDYLRDVYMNSGSGREASSIQIARMQFRLSSSLHSG
jgi:hypothetical protein